MQLEIRDGTYEYRSLLRRRVAAFSGLSVQFAPGKTALIGPNGAGKSTLMSVATGLLSLTEGTLSLEQQALSRQRKYTALRKVTALVPQRFTAIPGLTVLEHVVYSAWLKGLSAREARSHAAAALERVDLASLHKRPASRLSGGETRRLAIAQALVSQSRFLFMDEPTAGLDPLQMKEFNGLLAGLAPELALVVSTHDINDIDHRYDRVIVLDRGAIRFDGPIAEFTAIAGPDPAGSPFLAAYERLVRGPR